VGVADFVRFVLDDGSEVFFESAEGDLVALHDGGRLSARLGPVAEAASQVAGSLRARLASDEVALEFGLKVSGEVNWWFFAKNQAEGTIKVTLNWRQHDNGRPAEH
jgi:hypothetical protein